MPLDLDPPDDLIDVVPPAGSTGDPRRSRVDARLLTLLDLGEEAVHERLDPEAAPGPDRPTRLLTGAERRGGGAYLRVLVPIPSGEMRAEVPGARGWRVSDTVFALWLPFGGVDTLLDDAGVRFVELASRLEGSGPSGLPAAVSKYAPPQLLFDGLFAGTGFGTRLLAVDDTGLARPRVLRPHLLRADHPLRRPAPRGQAWRHRHRRGGAGARLGLRADRQRPHRGGGGAERSARGPRRHEPLGDGHRRADRGEPAALRGLGGQHRDQPSPTGGCGSRATARSPSAGTRRPTFRRPSPPPPCTTTPRERRSGSTARRARPSPSPRGPADDAEGSHDQVASLNLDPKLQVTGAEARVFQVWRAGRGGLDVGSAGCTVSPPATGRRTVVVGAADSAATLRPASAVGPTRDGRVRPDVCAKGSGLVIHGASDPADFAAPTRSWAALSFTDTSAAAYVAGVARQLFQGLGNIGGAAVKERLLASAASPGVPLSDAGWGWGHVTSADALAGLVTPDLADVGLRDASADSGAEPSTAGGGGDPPDVEVRLGVGAERGAGRLVDHFRTDVQASNSIAAEGVTVA